MTSLPEPTIRKFRIVQLDILNCIVNFYREFAELQALNRKSTYTRD